MFSAVKDCAYNALVYNTVLYSLIHTAVTSTADVNSGNGFISHHIIPSIQYSTVNCLISIQEPDLPLTQKNIKKCSVV